MPAVSNKRAALAAGSGYGLVFANLSFMILFAGQLISYLGDRLDQLTLLQLAREHAERQADTAVTIMTIALIVPFVLLAPWVGPVVDRFSRKTILIVTSACQGLVITAVPFLRPTAFVQEHALAMICLTIFLIGVFTAFFTPAKTALIAEIVDKRGLMAANSLTTFAGTIMNMLGSLVAAWILHLYDKGRVSLDVCFYIDAATYYVSGAMFFAIVVPDTPALNALRRQRMAEREPFARRIARALRYLGAHGRPLRLVTLSGSFGLLAGLVYALINAKTLNQLGASTSTYGVLMGVFGVALIGGGLAMTLWRRRLPSYEGFVVWAFVASAACAYWMAVAGDMRAPLPPGALEKAAALGLRAADGALIVSSAVFPLIVVGALGGALMVFIITMLQTSVPKRFHGRVFALDNLLYFAALILGLAAGVLFQSGIRHGWLTFPAVGLLVAAVALAIAFGAAALTERFRFRLMGLIARAFFRVFSRVEIEGREHVPTRGRLIVAANHSSYVDTVFIGMSMPRVVHYLTTSDWYYRWYILPIVKLFAAIPVPVEGGTTAALRAGLEVLKRQRVLGIFPEGHLSRDGRLQEARGGVGLLAARSGAPIVPVALIGAFDVYPRHRLLPRPAKARVRIGRPIDPAGMDRDQITAAVMNAIAGMLDQPWPPERDDARDPAPRELGESSAAVPGRPPD